MITVTYNGESFECTTALKGTDYIHLLDTDDVMIVAWEGVTDFTGFSISGGSWTTPTPADSCYLATIGDDGRILKGSHTCADVTNHTHDDRYYTESEVNTLLNAKSNTGHTHDDRYYTESEVNSLLSGKASTSHTHSSFGSLTLNNTLTLSSYTYGTVLPSAGTAGRIFFKKG